MEKRVFKHRLVFGVYPGVMNNLGKQIEVLKLQSHSILYSHIVMLWTSYIDIEQKVKMFIKIY